MPNWTPEELRNWELRQQLTHYALKTDSELQSPQPEQVVCHEPLGKNEGEEKSGVRIGVRITSFRNRLCDTDNLCVKALVDALRYLGLIQDDRPEDIELTVTQEKCAKSEERTEIELIIPDQ